ncbi:MAG: hypothetical protein K6F92_09365 [Lachnospiraceae bacterium]|nr:hypothetical protein [Lachnospiraceae bacterium]
MRRVGAIVLCAMLLTGCAQGGDSARNYNKKNDVADIINAAISSAEASTATDGAPVETQAQTEEVVNTAGATEETTVIEATNASGVDVDLTVMSASVVYAEVYSMMVAPETYIGKTVRMEGQFAYYYDEANDHYYYACIVMDATACCSQGIEFITAEEKTFPDDFPEPGSMIEVVGVFDTYMEGEYTYCTLRNATMTIQ